MVVFGRQLCEVHLSQLQIVDNEEVCDLGYAVSTMKQNKKEERTGLMTCLVQDASK